MLTSESLKATLLLIFFLLQLSVSNAQSQKTDNEIRDLDIYLLIGQSNMAGRAEIEKQDKDSLAGVYLFVGQNSMVWEPAANPLNKYSTIRKKIEMQKMGPGYALAKSMRSFYPSRKIGLVVNARGGTSIKEWVPGSKYFQEALTRLQVTSQYGSVRGVLWHQGESDVSNSANYIDDLIKIVNALRLEVDNADLPFVLGELSTDKTVRQSFNELISEIPNRVSRVAIASSKATETFDKTHFNSPSQRIMGENFAEKLRILTEN